MRLAAFALALSVATQADAGGIDITGQPITFMFSKGTVLELGVGYVAPHISGNDAAFFGGGSSGDIGLDFWTPWASLKHDFTDKLSFGVAFEKPFGSDTEFAATSVAFGNTTASADSASITSVLRYKITDRFSVHGGARWQTAEAGFQLQGALYGRFTGYTASAARDDAWGYLVGAAFEIPEYFLRISLTYNSAIQHTFATTETVGPLVATSNVNTQMPQSLNFEFTSGVAPKTFIFGGARWVDWSELQFAPPVLSAASPDPLVDYNDTITMRLGAGRQINEYWTGLASLIYEPGTDPATTPLTPVDGFYGASLGAVFAKDGFQVQTTLTYLRLGDAQPFVNAIGRTVSSFSGNSTLSVGVKLVKTF